MVNRRTNLVLWLSVIVLAILCFVFAAKYSMLRVRVAFADEQIAIFEAAKASTDKATDARELSGCLDYVVNYYPSGTKQARGTRLDRVVEAARLDAIAAIISRLRAATGEDLGSDPQRWLKEYPQGH